MQNRQDYLDGLNESEEVALKTKMYKAIKQGISESVVKSNRRKKAWRKAKIAASISFLPIAMFSVWVWTGDVETVYQTAENEVLELVLPDHSVITLNSNSTLSYQSSRFSEFDRKVQLEGEAFFSVQKNPEGKNFEVNGSSEFAVTVLGTKFSVKNSALVNKVTLIEGSVLLGYSGKNGNSEHLMAPGESIRVDAEKKELKSTRITNPEKLISWKDRKLKMEDERLEEVLNTLVEIYDLRLDATSIPLGETGVSGSLPLSDRPEEVFENLEILFDTPVELNGKTVTVNKAKQPKDNRAEQQ